MTDHFIIGVDAADGNILWQYDCKLYQGQPKSINPNTPIYYDGYVHADHAGFFYWSVEAPLPEKVEIRVYKRWSGLYETLKTTVPFSRIGRQPIILARTR